jgi:NAD(P)-dependent dehydrogenase (short-subunit alcohol dehydrogenase family)
MYGNASYDFGDVSAIVTGSTKGIGRGIAERLVDAGGDVVVNSRTEAAVEETVADLATGSDGTVAGVTADLGTVDGVERLVSTAVDRLNGVDLLVNNAAVWPNEASILDASLEDWDYTMDVNVRAQFYASQLVAQHMIEAGVEGAIVNVTSQTGDRRTGARGLYGVSKTSVNGLTWRLAHELAGHGIRVNAVSTDVTDSHQLRYEARLVAEEDPDRTTADVLREWGEAVPMGRLGRPQEIADAVLFLASDRAGYIVGTTIRVSGGGNLQ